MTSQAELEKKIAAEVDACTTSKKQATIGNFIFRRKSAWQGECESYVREKYKNELAAYAAQEDKIRASTDNAFLQIGSANAKLYLVAAIGFIIIISIVYILKNKK